MRKLLLVLLAIPFCQHLIAQVKKDSSVVLVMPSQNEDGANRVVASKDILFRIAKDYFRSNPFDRTFSEFLAHLINDPALINKIIYKRTDTSFFYLRGEYKADRPFFFLPKRVEVIVAESEEKLIDSLPTLDTVITYQLAGYTTGDADGLRDVKEEFEKFDHKYKKKFSQSNYLELKNGNTINGAMHNYFIVNLGLAPLAVAWQKIGTANEHVFVITFRFKIKNNQVFLAVPSDYL